MTYIKLYFIQMKQALMSMSIFRANFLLMLLQGFINSALGVLCIKFIYLHVNMIAGWTETELILLWCTYTIVCQLCRAFINPNHWRFIQSISTGGFDKYILKPVSLPFQINNGRVDLSSKFSIILPLVILFVLLSGQEQAVQFRDILLYAFFIFVGVSIISSFMMLLYSTVFKFIKVSSLSNIFYVIMNIAERPIEIFSGKGWLISLIFFIPAVPVANIPVRFLIGKGEISHIIMTVSAGIILFILSRLAIRFGMRKYESAGG